MRRSARKPQAKKLSLDSLTPRDWLALGYCFGTGLSKAVNSGNTDMEQAIQSLWTRVHLNNERSKLIGGMQSTLMAEGSNK